METVIYIVVYIFLILVGALSIISTIVLVNYKKSEVALKKVEPASLDTIKLVLEKNSFDNVNILIDTIIKDAIDMYNILSGVSDETYINTKMTEEMASYVYGMTVKKMTPAVKGAIGLFYDIDTDEKLDELLKLRIKLHLINEIYTQNLPIQS